MTSNSVGMPSYDREQAMAALESDIERRKHAVYDREQSVALWKEAIEESRRASYERECALIADGFGTARSDFIQGVLYGKHAFGDAYVGAAVAFGTRKAKTDRTVNVAIVIERLTGAFDADTIGGRIEAGYRFCLGTVGITPYAALQVQNVSTPTDTEAAAFGAGTASLAFGDQFEAAGAVARHRNLDRAVLGQHRLRA
jgi:Autotransporter beta-domain